MKRALLILALCALVGCKSMQPVVVEKKTTETVHDTVQLVDSVYRDRIKTIYMQGDTTYIRDSVFLFKYKYIDRDHEVYIHDSIPYCVEVEKPVRVRNGYDRFTSWGFWILFALLLACIGWKIAKVYLRAQSGGIL